MVFFNMLISFLNSGLIKVLTHWLPHSDHSVQLDHVGVSELSHDGRLLEELDFVCLVFALVGLDGHFHGSPRTLPQTLVDCTKRSTP